jgi:PAS domain S-box-containing protein
MATPATQIQPNIGFAVDSAACPMVLTNHEGKIVLVNKYAEDLFGYSRQELVGQTIEILVPESSRGAHASLRVVFCREPHPRPLTTGRDLQALRKDGSLFPVDIGLIPIQTKEGIWVLSSIIDISGRKRAEAQFRESEERFRSMVDASPVMLWMTGPDNLCTFFNKGWLEFTGRSLEQELGNGWAKGVHPEDLKHCLGFYGSSFDAHRSFQMEYRLRRSDGEYRWMVVTGVPRFGPWGDFAGYIGSGVDIHDLKLAQDELATHKLESLGLLTGGLAHDFNNMQSAIIALSETMLESPDMNQFLAEDLREIRKIAMHGSELVHELMIHLGEDRLNVQPVSVPLLVEGMQQLLKHSISKRAHLELHLSRDLPLVRARPAHIRQIVMNLVINASEAIGEHTGVIDVSASLLSLKRNQAWGAASSLPEGDYIQLKVSDTGCGMTQDVQQNILHPFFSTKRTGRGLGLSVVQGIFRQYGGALEIESVPGVWTCFEILIPCARQTTV